MPSVILIVRYVRDVGFDRTTLNWVNYGWDWVIGSKVFLGFMLGEFGGEVGTG